MNRKELITISKKMNKSGLLEQKIKFVAVKTENIEKSVAEAINFLSGKKKGKALLKAEKDAIKWAADFAVEKTYDEEEEEEEEEVEEEEKSVTDEEEEEDEEDEEEEEDSPSEDFKEETIKAAAAIGIKVESDSETEDSFIRRICKAIDSLTDKKWDALDESIQDWCNEWNKVFKAQKKAAKEAKKSTKKEKTDKDSTKGKKSSKSSTGSSTNRSAGKHGQDLISIGKEWKPGSKAQSIFEAAKKAGKKGITLETLISKCSDCKEYMVKNMWDSIVVRELGKHEGKKLIIN